MATTTSIKGTITRLFADKGFGFLRGSDGIEYFFHQSAAEDWVELIAGSPVLFTPTQGLKGPRAEHVERA